MFREFLTDNFRLESQSHILLILKNLHDLNILLHHNSQGIRYLGSCRMFSIHSRVGA